MKATITNPKRSPKGFYVGHDQIVIQPGKSIDGDYDDGLLIALKSSGFEVDHKGTLKVGATASTGKTESKEIIEAAKTEAEKIIAEAKAEAEKILAEAKELADAEIAKADDAGKK